MSSLNNHNYHNCAEIRKAGMIIMNQDGNLALVKTKGWNKWGFPKGHLEDNEKEWKGALREVREECGIDLKTEAYEYIGSIWLRSIKFFVVVMINDHKLLQTHDTKEISDCKWEEIGQILDFPRKSINATVHSFQIKMAEAGKLDRLISEANRKRIL